MFAENRLGAAREQLLGVAALSRTFGEDCRSLFVLERQQAYLDRADDRHVKRVASPTNDIERAQNALYGQRKYRAFELTQFAQMTERELFESVLAKVRRRRRLLECEPHRSGWFCGGSGAHRQDPQGRFGRQRTTSTRDSSDSTARAEPKGRGWGAAGEAEGGVGADGGRG